MCNEWKKTRNWNYLAIKKAFVPKTQMKNAYKCYAVSFYYRVHFMVSLYCFSGFTWPLFTLFCTHYHSRAVLLFAQNLWSFGLDKVSFYCSGSLTSMMAYVATKQINITFDQLKNTFSHSYLNHCKCNDNVRRIIYIKSIWYLIYRFTVYNGEESTNWSFKVSNVRIHLCL